MSNVNRLLDPVRIPRVVKIRQVFDDTRLEDVPAALLAELEREEVVEIIRPGMSIAITAGSRGIDNLALVIKTLVGFLKERGAEPFVIPAMGSHGGSSAEGQKAVIAEYGVVEEYIGCPVRATMEVDEIGRLDDGRPILINHLANQADGIISLNRIKAHTAFHRRYESGVMKMMTIGLGCQKGAENCHRQGIMHLGENVEKFAFGILKNAKILLGVGLIENAFDRTCMVKVMTKEQIPEVEPLLLEIAKSKMSHILFDKVDVLIVDRIGKNISGEGMDPNVTGRYIVPNLKGGIQATRTGVLDLTDETLGNFVGLGMVDTCSKRVVDKIDIDATYPNSLTSTVTELCKIPMYFDNHRYTIKASIKMVPGKSPEECTMIRIRDTLSLHEIEISENLVPLARKTPGIEILSEPYELCFNENGDLF
ncbi:MAG: DUF2088 domain-containing protein [Spirochaetales bacterium]|nr:DUF2088 domain-containing protein [Spirochaetales bacterium]